MLTSLIIPDGEDLKFGKNSFDCKVLNKYKSEIIIVSKRANLFPKHTSLPVIAIFLPILLP